MWLSLTLLSVWLLPSLEKSSTIVVIFPDMLYSDRHEEIDTRMQYVVVLSGSFNHVSLNFFWSDHCNLNIVACELIVQSLNSPFFPPPIGAEPGRAKGESRITCMRMLRTNQSKITRVLTTLPSSMCRAMPFSARALKKKFSLALILW